MSDHFQLKKIILIDSFWAGKTVLLNLDGHTNLSGTNGAGKTTFLRLMQLFWGERPSNIVGGTGSKKGFLDYYLPRSNSYLIYEYQRPHQQVCHVMVQSDGRGARYKFIDAPYNKEFYIDENDFPRDGASIDRLYRSTVETSKLMGVDDYCSVIQCHQVGSGKKELRPLQRRFAMAATPITHIEKVIGSVIEKIGDFDIIKQMLIDISRDKLSHNLLDQEQEKNPFQLNKQHIDAWLADLNAARELEGNREYFDELLQTIAALKDTLNELSHIHYLALLNHQKTQLELTAIAQRIEHLKIQREQLKQNHEQQLAPKIDQLSELKVQIKQLDFEIQSLEEQKLEYEQQDAESFAIKGALLEQHQQKQKDIQQEIEALESKSKEINALYEQKLTDLAHRHNSQLQNLNNQRTTEQLTKEQQLSEAQSVFQQRKDQLDQDQAARQLPVNDKKSQLSIDLGITKAKLNNIPVPAALQQQLSQTQQELETVRKDTKQAYQAQEAAQSIYTSALAGYQAIEEQVKAKKAELKNTQQQHSQCHKRLRPEPGTLQYFLENEVDRWEHNIGRVIAPELLESKDLEPQLTESAHSDFYGLQINLERLAERANLTADKASLEQQEKALFTHLERLKNDLEQLEASLIAANKMREQSRIELDQAKLHVQRFSKNEERLLSEEDGVKNLIKAEQAKTHAEIEQEIQRLSQEILDCEQRLKSISSDNTNQLDNLYREHLARRGAIESDSDNSIKTIASQIDAENSAFTQEHQRITQQLKTDLQVNGADDTILELNKQLKQRKADEQQARLFQSQAKDYQNWLQQRWQQHPSLCQQRSSSHQKILKLDDDIKQSENDYKHQRAQLNQEITTQDTQQEVARSLLIQLNSTMDQLKSCPPMLTGDNREYAPATLLGLTQAAMRQRKQQESSLHKGRQTLVQLFNKHHRSQLAEAWQKAMELSTGPNDYFQAEALEIEHPLINVLQMVANVKQATSQQIDLHANDVNAFYQHLRQFESILKNTGTELSKHVSEKQYFAALGEITVTVRSKMNDLEYWQALKKFGDNYHQYLDQVDLTGHDEIPKSLIEAMSELTSMLPATGVKIKHLSLFDIEFSIIENGQIKHARNAKELKDVSSTGLSYLALITFFTGVTSMLRKQNNTIVCWPIDELGDLAPENIEAMMTMLAKQNIHIMSATPTADRHVLGLFERRYLLDKQQLHEVNLPESKLDQLLNNLNAEALSHV